MQLLRAVTYKSVWPPACASLWKKIFKHNEGLLVVISLLSSCFSFFLTTSHQIKCLLAELGWALWENIWFSAICTTLCIIFLCMGLPLSAWVHPREVPHHFVKTFIFIDIFLIFLINIMSFVCITTSKFLDHFLVCTPPF